MVLAIPETGTDIMLSDMMTERSLSSVHTMVMKNWLEVNQSFHIQKDVHEDGNWQRSELKNSDHWLDLLKEGGHTFTFLTLKIITLRKLVWDESRGVHAFR